MRFGGDPAWFCGRRWVRLIRLARILRRRWPTRFLAKRSVGRRPTQSAGVTEIERRLITLAAKATANYLHGGEQLRKSLRRATRAYRRSCWTPGPGQGFDRFRSMLSPLLSRTERRTRNAPALHLQRPYQVLASGHCRQLL